MVQWHSRPESGEAVERCDVLKVVDLRTGAETAFASADELIAAGWALD